jgi:KDO2-lipid IV(A) lauroyltransferase
MYPLVHTAFLLLSRLPLRVLYAFSDVLSLIAFHVVRYRRAVVLANLRTAFPEKSEAERRRIAMRFYRNFTDMVMDGIKVLTMSDSELSQRFIIRPELKAAFDRCIRSGKSYQIHAMHNFGWEIVNLGVSRALDIPFLGVYMPIKNRALERIFRKVRVRYGTVLLPATDFKNRFSEVERRFADRNYLLALVADQSPGRPQDAWWLNFFGVPTGFIHGPEKAARDRRLGVIFGYFYPVERGRYTFDIEIVTEDASTTPEGELTLAYARYIERHLRMRPDNYLWSHRRWKHAYRPEYAGRALEPLNGVS